MSLKVTAVLLEQIQDGHKYLTQTMDGVTNEVAAFMPPGKANPIAGTFAHLVMSEDFFVHMLLQQKQPLFESEYKDKTGASEIQPTEWETAYPKWLKEVRVDINQINAYAQAVYAATEKYVAGLSEEELEKKIDMNMFGMGERTVISVISGMITLHTYSIMGEVSVLKGIQGLRGYPF